MTGPEFEQKTRGGIRTFLTEYPFLAFSSTVIGSGGSEIFVLITPAKGPPGRKPWSVPFIPMYNNASEVIREALRFMDTHEDWIREIKLARLREQLTVGADQLDRGEGIAIESRAALDVLFDDAKGRYP